MVAHASSSVASCAQGKVAAITILYLHVVACRKGEGVVLVCRGPLCAYTRGMQCIHTPPRMCRVKAIISLRRAPSAPPMAAANSNVKAEQSTASATRSSISARFCRDRLSDAELHFRVAAQGSGACLRDAAPRAFAEGQVHLCFIAGRRRLYVLSTASALATRHLVSVLSGLRRAGRLPALGPEHVRLAPVLGVVVQAVKQDVYKDARRHEVVADLCRLRGEPARARASARAAARSRDCVTAGRTASSRDGARLAAHRGMPATTGYMRMDSFRTLQR
jgi:hypothetical protein